jgi:hypothetical protein
LEELTMPLFALSLAFSLASDLAADTPLTADLAGATPVADVFDAGTFALPAVPFALGVPFALVVLGFLVVVPGLLVVLDLAVPLPLLFAAVRLLLIGALRTTPPPGRDAADVAEAPTVALPTIGRLRNRMCCCPSVHTLVVTQ